MNSSTASPTRSEVLAYTSGDAELTYKLKGMDGRIRLTLAGESMDLLVEDARIGAVVDPVGDPVFGLNLPAEVFAAESRGSLRFTSAFRARRHGVEILGDPATVIAPYAAAIERLYALLLTAGQTTELEAPSRALFKETDTAIGRYVYIDIDGVEYRMYYEEAGTGDIPLLLQHTAGGDARQWRHQLADPEFQYRFRVIAYDLPYHGRSLPPTDLRWWEEAYKPTKEWIEKVIVAFSDALGLDSPFFMGCSVGGQLALDLAADYGDRFGAYFALNGTLDNPLKGDAIIATWNDRCRDNRFSNEQVSTGMYFATSPNAPEPYRREVYWGYRSNFPGVYAGDNDYFMDGHDLTVNGEGLAALTSPLYVLGGEYDPAALDPEHGAPAVGKLFPNVDFRELKNLSHFAPTDDPLTFREAMLPILDEALTRTGALKSSLVP
ncbi:alpha/beta fold hydrolase [Arthrobacter sp. SAFR-044]|uniref:alpha/beta fold hydrolase n=1 Tax=Arthrobacter sp. SAFR-044 TaxID=3387278 RepID=UPI003F7C2B47